MGFTKWDSYSHPKNLKIIKNKNDLVNSKN